MVPFNQIIESHAGDSQAFYKYKKYSRNILETSVTNSPEYKAKQELKRIKARIT